MTVIKILAVVVGTAFLFFGYMIRFQKKYRLINGFEADRKAGRKTERDARRIGLIEFILGAVLLITGIILIIFA